MYTSADIWCCNPSGCEKWICQQCKLFLEHLILMKTACFCDVCKCISLQLNSMLKMRSIWIYLLLWRYQPLYSSVVQLEINPIRQQVSATWLIFNHHIAPFDCWYICHLLKVRGRILSFIPLMELHEIWNVGIGRRPNVSSNYPFKISGMKDDVSKCTKLNLELNHPSFIIGQVLVNLIS